MTSLSIYIASDPTIQPTLSPSYDALGLRQLEYQPNIDTLTSYYQYITITIIVVSFIFIVTTKLISKFININDYIRIGAMISGVVQMNDMISDCFFIAQVNVQRKIYLDWIYDMICFVSIGFIVIPIFLSLFQLYSTSKYEWKDIRIRSWLQKYSTILFIFAVLFGSSFTAIYIVNSCAINNIKLFNMGLTDRELKKFNTKRIYSTVLFENIPQLIIQTLYIYSFNGFNNDNTSNSIDAITISSILFSVLSITISILTLCLQQSISDEQEYIIISMDIIGDSVEEKANKCKSIRNKILNRFASILGKDRNSMDMSQPSLIPGGLKVNIYLYFNKNENQTNRTTSIAGELASECDTLLQESMNNGKLAMVFQTHWDLRKKPEITNIDVNTHEIKRAIDWNQAYKNKRKQVTDTDKTEKEKGEHTDNNNAGQLEMQQYKQINLNINNNNDKMNEKDENEKDNNNGYKMEGIMIQKEEPLQDEKESDAVIISTRGSNDNQFPNIDRLESTPM